MICLTDVLAQEHFQTDPDQHAPTSIMFSLKINFQSGDSDLAGNSVIKLEILWKERTIPIGGQADII